MIKRHVVGPIIDTICISPRRNCISSITVPLIRYLNACQITGQCDASLEFGRSVAKSLETQDVLISVTIVDCGS